jgi:hypothetical protein
VRITPTAMMDFLIVIQKLVHSNNALRKPRLYGATLYGWWNDLEINVSGAPDMLFDAR